MSAQLFSSEFPLLLIVIFPPLTSESPLKMMSSKELALSAGEPPGSKRTSEDRGVGPRLPRISFRLEATAVGSAQTGAFAFWTASFCWILRSMGVSSRPEVGSGQTGRADL